MLCLSIRQPWAWAILHCGKNIENRSWRTAVRGPFLVHASQRVDPAGLDFLAALGLTMPTELPTGGIVGIAEIYDCVNTHSSKWFFGPWGFLLRGQRPLPYVPLRGQLGFFKTSIMEAWRHEMNERGHYKSKGNRKEKRFTVRYPNHWEIALANKEGVAEAIREWVKKTYVDPVIKNGPQMEENNA